MQNTGKNKATLRVTRRERETTIETEFPSIPSIPYKHLVYVAEIKQKEILLKYLYLPFWISLDGILVFLAGILAFLGAWYLFSGFIFFIGFSTHTVYRSKKQLKKIGEELSASASPVSLEQPTEMELEEKQK